MRRVRAEFVDRKGKEMKVIPENPDDLWHLYNVIRKGDIVFGITYRKMPKRDDMARSKEREKVKVRLGIQVEDVSFHPFSNMLRIKGKIVAGVQEGLGSYHTINVRPGDQISIIKKEGWRKYELERIKEAVEASKRPSAIFVSLDDSEGIVAKFTQRGIEICGEAYRRGSKEGEWGDKEFYGELFSILERNYEGGPVIIVGPGFAKEHFADFIKERGFRAPLRVIGTSHAGINGIKEAIKLGAVEEIVKKERVAKEIKRVEELFSEIFKGGLVTYGMKEVRKALDYGAVEELLILDEVARTDEGEELMKRAEEIGAKVMVISSEHEGGAKLKGLGGAMAKLRYKVRSPSSSWLLCLRSQSFRSTPSALFCLWRVSSVAVHAYQLVQKPCLCFRKPHLISPFSSSSSHF